MGRHYGRADTQKRFDLALPFFHKLGYTADVFMLVNDATAVLPSLGYRADDDTVHGLATGDTELHVLDIHAGESMEAFLQRFRNHKLATQVEIVALVPLKLRCPALVLGVFAQSGSDRRRPR